MSDGNELTQLRAELEAVRRESRRRDDFSRYLNRHPDLRGAAHLLLHEATRLYRFHQVVYFDLQNGTGSYNRAVAIDGFGPKTAEEHQRRERDLERMGYQTIDQLTLEPPEQHDPEFFDPIKGYEVDLTKDSIFRRVVDRGESYWGDLVELTPIDRLLTERMGTERFAAIAVKGENDDVIGIIYGNRKFSDKPFDDQFHPDKELIRGYIEQAAMTIQLANTNAELAERNAELERHADIFNSLFSGSSPVDIIIYSKDLEIVRASYYQGLPGLGEGASTGSGVAQAFETGNLIVSRIAGQGTVYEETAIPVKDTRGDTYYVMAIYTDISELVSSQRLATVGRFAAHVVHEIKNPLVTIGGFGRQISKRTSDEGIRKKADVIVAEVARLENVVMPTLDFTRPTQLKQTNFDIYRLTSDVVGVYVEGMGPQGDHRMNLGYKHTKPNPLMVYADRDQTYQVLLNLTRNAFEAMNQDPAKVQSAPGMENVLSISHMPDGGYVETRFHNIQCIPPDFRESVLEPFMTTKKDGTGLGLAVCKKIADDSGGYLSFESYEDRGTTFCLGLPIAKGD